MSKTYTARPVEVEAEQFVVYVQNGIPDFETIHGIMFPVYKNERKQPYILIPINGQEYPFKVNNLDWIIKDDRGVFSVKTDDQFQREYQKGSK